MGILERLRRMTGLAGQGTPAAVASPWSARPTHLEPARILAGVLGEDTPLPVTRAEAMSIPALARARQLIVSTVARLPVYAAAGGERLETQPRWIDRTDGPVSPYHRMSDTVDDLLFYGWSLWALDRDYDGRVIAADRVPVELWSVGEDGDILIEDEPVAARDVCLIPGPHEGILKIGAKSVRHARVVLDAVERAARNPSAQTELHQTNDAPLTAEEAIELRDSWAAARRGEHGGIGVTTHGIEVRDHGAPISDLLIDGRNAAAVDIARLCGVPATIVDATLQGSSLSYSSTESRMNELITFGLSPFMAAIAGRLGMDDMVPRGTRIEFDISETILPRGELDVPDDQTTKPRIGDYLS